MLEFSSLRHSLVLKTIDDSDMPYRLSSALQISPQKLSPDLIGLNIVQMAEGLAFPASRPEAERQIAELFRISKLSILEFQTETLERVFRQDVMNSLISLRIVDRELDIIEGLKNSQIRIKNDLDQEQQMLTGKLKGFWENRLSKSIKEIYLIALFDNQNLTELSDRLKKSASRYDLPEIFNQTFFQAKEQFSQLKIVEKLFDYSDRLLHLKKKFIREAADDRSLPENIFEVFEKPGLLFFSDDSFSDSHSTGRQSSYRKQLRFILKDKPELNSIITELLHSTARFISILENDLSAQHKQQRPDINLLLTKDMLANLLKALSSADLSRQSRKQLESVLQQAVDRDYQFGTGLSDTLFLDHPRSAGSDGEKIAIKIVPLPDRQGSEQKNQVAMLIMPAQSDHTVYSAPELHRRVRLIMDGLAISDRFTEKKLLNRLARLGLHIISKTFSAADRVINQSGLNLTPEMHEFDKQPALIQFASIWLMASTLQERYNRNKLPEIFFNNLEDWLLNYGFVACNKSKFDFTDLAGFAPFAQLIGENPKHKSFNFVEQSVVKSFYSKYPQNIMLLPASFQALLSLWNDESHQNIFYAVRKCGLIIDLPSHAVIREFEHSNRRRISDQISKIRQVNGDVRLSMLFSLSE